MQSESGLTLVQSNFWFRPKRRAGEGSPQERHLGKIWLVARLAGGKQKEKKNIKEKEKEEKQILYYIMIVLNVILLLFD